MIPAIKVGEREKKKEFINKYEIELALKMDERKLKII